MKEVQVKRRTREEIAKGVRLSWEALDNLCKSNLNPGFDYAAALCELNTVYDYKQIAEFCHYASKASISKVMSGKTIPSHPLGELIYILYCETFGKKPKSKSFQK